MTKEKMSVCETIQDQVLEEEKSRSKYIKGIWGLGIMLGIGSLILVIVIAIKSERPIIALFVALLSMIYMVRLTYIIKLTVQSNWKIHIETV